MSVLPAPPPAHAAPLPPPRTGAGGVRVLDGVPYADLPGARPLELDLYLPAAASDPAPVVVFVHGGGWWSGSRRLLGPAYPTSSPTPFEQVAAAGVAVASVDYRLSGEAIWPAPLHDVKAAVRWLRSRAAEVGIDPGRVAAWGESAGGHLAALAGLTGAEAPGSALEGEVGVTGPSSAVVAVAAWYTPSDLAAMPADLGRDPMAPASREAQLVGGPLAALPEVTAQASPVTHVRPGAPPFLLLHGEDDTAVPCVQSERFAAALEAAGGRVRLERYKGAGHQWGGSAAAARSAMAETTAFLREHLGA